MEQMVDPAGEAVGLQVQAGVDLQDAVVPVEGAAGWWGLADAEPSEDHLAVVRGPGAADLVEEGAVEKGGVGSLVVAVVDLLVGRKKDRKKDMKTEESSTPSSPRKFCVLHN